MQRNRRRQKQNEVTLAKILKKLAKDVNTYRETGRERIRYAIQSTKTFILEPTPERDLAVFAAVLISFVTLMAYLALIIDNLYVAMLEYYLTIPLVGVLGTIVGIRIEKAYGQHERVYEVLHNANLPASLLVGEGELNQDG